MFIICTDYRKLPALKIHELSGFRENRVHLGSCDRASWNVRWREINQQDATNPMFIIEFLCQHVSQQHYAHPQEKKTVYYYIWCSALVVLAVVVCSWVVSCVHCVKVTVRLSILLVYLSSPYSAFTSRYYRRRTDRFIWRPSPYRAVNTFHLGYKNQSVYAVSGTSRCLFWDTLALYRRSADRFI